MNLKLFTALLFLAISDFGLSQTTVKMTNEYGFKNIDLQGLIDFENIFLEKLIFEGENIEGMSYVIEVVEYKNGKELTRNILFDGTELDYFKVASEKEMLSFYFKLSDRKLKIQMRGKNFGSKKLYFDLDDNAEKYALKDFFGSNPELNMPIKGKNAVLALITPNMHENGSASYCEVAQSNIRPEKLGSHFNIPHYFIITVDFK
ncbi:hypothetical protein [Aquimarina rubra]|uniref:Uncharacterized protein n=1 Tax=Aquimarina rubra TaxID=1920033 RepID=A0ABW5LH84_9FLAO